MARVFCRSQTVVAALLVVLFCANSTLAMAQFYLRTAPAPIDLQDQGFSPGIAGDGAGNWVAVWSTSDSLSPAHVLAARSADNGATWSAGVQLDPDTNVLDGFLESIPIQVATDGSGVWIAIWSKMLTSTNSDRHTFVSRSADNGATWSDPIMLNSSVLTSTPLDTPHIATDRNGNWIAVFSPHPFFDEIYVVRSSDNGITWSAATPLHIENNSGERFPRVATDGNGTWIIVWSINIDLGDEFANQIHMARSTDNGATWSDPALVSTTGRSDWYSSIASDGAGRWVVVWQSPTDDNSEFRIMAAHSSDNGTTWSTSTPVGSHVPGTNEQEPVVATDSAGNWVAVWYVYPPPAYVRTMISRSSDHGATWTTPEQFGNYFSSSSPAVASDGAGHWIGVWSQLEGIFYTRWSNILEPDRDGDNLSDADEAIAGSSSDTWDTDSDTLSDEEEVNTLGTSPLATDTDGDGVWDFIEISLGFDPNDALDFPVLPLPASALVALALGAFGAAAIAMRRRGIR